MNNIVELKNVVKIYHRGDEELHSVAGIDLAVGKGDFVSIVGPSGSGKTTLLNLVGCVDTPTSGTIKIDAMETSRLREKYLAKVRNKKIGFVFQQFFLLPTLTALENVALPALFSEHKAKEERARELLSVVGLSGREHHLPAHLSGGEMQRVAIARALINDPKLLLADEPTGNLDTANAEAIFGLFEKLNQRGLTIIAVTHNMELAKRTKTVRHLKDGRFVD
ncbi:MAG: ABC transporter ATP-binding protein [Nitrospiraceae bacterium]|nr:ABC transporter ATP-binding protein [Nitrospiraceae bacterium]